MGGAPWLAVIRDLVLLGIGSAGLIREIFFVTQWDVTRVALFLAMIAGSGILNATWLLRHSPTVTATTQQLPPSSSSSLSPPQH